MLFSLEDGFACKICYRVQSKNKNKKKKCRKKGNRNLLLIAYYFKKIFNTIFNFNYVSVNTYVLRKKSATEKKQFFTE